MQFWGAVSSAWRAQNGQGRKTDFSSANCPVLIYPRAFLRSRAVRQHLQLSPEPVGEAQLAPPPPAC